MFGVNNKDTRTIYIIDVSLMSLLLALNILHSSVSIVGLLNVCWDKELVYCRELDFYYLYSTRRSTTLKFTIKIKIEKI